MAVKGIYDLIIEYEEKFNERPTIFGYPLEDQITMLIKAIESGDPIEEPKIPKGAVV